MRRTNAKPNPTPRSWKMFDKAFESFPRPMLAGVVPPKITHVTSGGHLQVRKGSPVRLECSATGNPMPNITWTRKNNLLPNGEEQFTNPVYVIENMDRHKGGTYICTANNGVGQVATSQIILHVLCK
uniref:Ig-like domain-containing protein n=1 Tax=Anopheles coluzzii TaxID=1518534 RepID=A0A8W7PTQ0_ANOCL